MANVKNIQKGTDIMVFVKQDGVYKSIAHATSHTFSMSGETQEVNSKDYGEFGSSTVNKINWEITSENLMTEDYEVLFDLMLAKNQVDLVFGMKAESGNIEQQVTNDYYTPKSNVASGYQGAKTGKAYITSLQENAPNGENATFTVTFTGIGAISRIANAS